jgi:hypothetical protein
MEFPERKEDEYWHVAHACNSGLAGVFSSIADKPANRFSKSDSSHDWRLRDDSQRTENANRKGITFENKSEKELNSLVKTKFKFNIQLSKIINLFKKK